MINKYKKYTLSVVGLLLLVTGITYSFFNYTRTGEANTIKTGLIHFSTSQDGILNITNLFPISSSDLTNANTLTVTVIGDTNYSDGLEYVITAEEVNIRTNEYRKIPISLDISIEDDSENPTYPLGIENNNYFSGRGSTTSMYKVLANELTQDHQELFVGYIAPFTGNTASGVDGRVVGSSA